MPKKTVDIDLIKRFSTVFKDSGLTQGAFGKRIGQEPHAISQVLGGSREPSKAMLRKVVGAFDVSPEWLLEGLGSMRKEPAPIGAFVSREDFAEMKGDLQGQIRELRIVVEALGEAIRTLNRRFPE